MTAHRGETVECVTFVQVEPAWWSAYGRTPAGEKYLDRIKVARATATQPDRPKPGTVTVKLRLRFPADVFYPLAPEAVVEIGSDLVRANLPVVVDAVELEDVER